MGMMIPRRPYTPRELTVCGLLGAGTTRPVRSVLNVGMRNPHRPEALWWLDICRANNAQPTVLEIHSPNVVEIGRHVRGCEVIQGDVCDLDAAGLTIDRPFDVVLWWHGPEHVDHPRAVEAIRDLQARTRQLLIVGCPLGFEEQGPVRGNRYEHHVSAWYPETFAELGMQTMVVDHDGRQRKKNAHITAWVEGSACGDPSS